MKQRLLTLLLLLSITSQLFAQPNYAPPSGVYCSCGPTTGNGFGSVNPQVAQKDFVQGILVRIGWNLCEPQEDQYDWTLLEGQITAAKQYSKKISLAFVNGKLVPDWVFAKGVASMQVLAPNTLDTIVAPWDSTHLHHWTDFIAAAGQHFQSDTTIRLVYITNASTNGCEMQLPFNSNPSLASLSYSDEKVINSWKTVTTAFKDAFPNHYLSNDFHPVNGSNVVADSVYAFASSSIGTRYGANAWWWTQRNTTVYPAQYTLLKKSAAENPFTGVQFANNGTQDSASFGAGGMPEALAHAIRDKVCYWEIWNQDILNPEFEMLLSSASCLNTGILPLAKKTLEVFPNPNSGKFQIKLDHVVSETIAINVYAGHGELVYNAAHSNKDLLEIDLGKLSEGIYFLEVNDAQVVYRQKLLIR